MNGWRVAWQTMRVLRWALWIGFIAFAIYFMRNRAPHFTPLGQLKLSAEAYLFGLPMAAVFAGCMELLCRERVQGEEPNVQH